MHQPAKWHHIRAYSILEKSMTKTLTKCKWIQWSMKCWSLWPNVCMMLTHLSWYIIVRWHHCRVYTILKKKKLWMKSMKHEMLIMVTYFCQMLTHFPWCIIVSNDMTRPYSILKKNYEWSQRSMKCWSWWPSFCLRLT